MHSKLRGRCTYRLVFVGAAPRSAASHLHSGNLSPASQSTAEPNPAKHTRARETKPWKHSCLNRSKSGLRFETDSILSRGKKPPTFERIMFFALFLFDYRLLYAFIRHSCLQKPNGSMAYRGKR